MLVKHLTSHSKKLIRRRQMPPCAHSPRPFPLESQTLANIELFRATVPAPPAGNSCGLWLFRTRGLPVLVRL